MSDPKNLDDAMHVIDQLTKRNHDQAQLIRALKDELLELKMPNETAQESLSSFFEGH